MKVCVTVRPNNVGGYTACCPALPGCQAAGPTQEQAIEGIDRAIRSYMASLDRPEPEHIDKVLLPGRQRELVAT